MALMLRSRKALEGARKAFELFKRQDVIEFHLTWTLCAALLGAVDDAFREYDINRHKSSAIGAFMNELWEERSREPESEIGKKVRNEILHRYEMHYEGDDVYEHGVFETGVFEAREYRRKTFKGDHPTGIIERGIEWWDNILSEIEAKAAEGQP